MKNKRAENSTGKKSVKSLMSMLDIGNVKSLLLSLQDISKISGNRDLVFYTTKMRADFLASR